MQILKIILIVVLLYLSIFESKADTILIDQKFEMQYIVNQFDYKIDTTGTQSWQSINSLPFDTYNDRVINLGFTNSFYWFKVHIKNTINTDRRYYLDIKNQYLEYVQVFILQNNKLVKEYKYGSRVEPTRIIEIELDTNSQKTILIKAKSNSPLRLPVFIYTSKQVLKEKTINSLFQGLYYGILIFIFLVTAYIYLFLREKLYLNFGLTVFSVLLYSLGYDNLLIDFTIKQRPELLLNVSTSMIAMLLYFYFTFSKYFFNSKSKVFNMLIDVLRVYALILFAVIIFSINVGNKLIYISMPAISLTMLIGAIYAYMVLKIKHARLFIIATFLLIVGSSLHILAALGYLSNYFVWQFAFKTGYLLQLIVFTLAVIDRYAMQQENFTHLLQEKIIERTHELEHVNGELLTTNEELHTVNEQLKEYQQNLENLVIVRTRESYESSNSLQALIDSSPLAIFDLDEKGNVLSVWNPAAEFIFGWQKHEVLGKPLVYIDKNSRDEYLRLLKRLSNGETIHYVELDRIKKDGKQISLRAALTPIFNTKNELVRIISIVENITDRKQFDKRLFETMLTTEENERRRLAGDLHDELGPQLASMRIYATSLKKRLEKPEQLSLIEELLELIKTSIANVREISGNLSPHMLENYGLTAAIQTEVNIRSKSYIVEFENNIEKNRFDKNIEITFYRIVKELMYNTLKYAQATKVQISLYFRNNNLHLTYSDNGQGFDYKKLIQNNYKGLGLLNIQTRVRSLNGNCSIESTQGNGFKLELFSPATITNNTSDGTGNNS